MPRSVSTFLMFTQGSAEEAVNLYVSVFKAAAPRKLERWGAGEPGKEGTVKRAEFSLRGHELVAMESPGHAFTFTPSFSLWVECESEAELDQVYAQLSAGGQEMMPLGNYGFSKKFGWIADRFGVCWQLNLA